MRRIMLLLAGCIPLFIIIGCSEEEMVRVGTPFEDDGTTGAEYHTDYTDSETIAELRKLIEMEEKTEPPEELSAVADLVIIFDKPKENVSELRRYVWYLEDGNSVLSNRESPMTEGSNSEFYTLNEEQTIELKGILD